MQSKTIQNFENSTAAKAFRAAIVSRIEGASAADLSSQAVYSAPAHKAAGVAA